MGKSAHSLLKIFKILLNWKKIKNVKRFQNGYKIGVQEINNILFYNVNN
jgi:hypothetical protein